MPEEIFEQKKMIRQHIRELKKEYNPAQKQLQANEAFKQLELLPEFQKAHNVFIYWSLNDELPTHAFIEKWKDKKRFLLPSIAGEDIILKIYSPGKKMLEGAMGIMEPDSITEYNCEIDLIVVPGIAFDRKKNRLGRGKAYYDNFLTKHYSLKIGICFDFQLVEFVPISPHDIKMDLIITPKEIVM
jgi:5-formyltetrahydrofolate cyclo-ligase